MRVTKIRITQEIYPHNIEERFTIVIDDLFEIRKVRLYKNSKGEYRLDYPSEHIEKNNREVTIVHPIDDSLNKYLTKSVVDAMEAATWTN